MAKRQTNPEPLDESEFDAGLEEADSLNFEEEAAGSSVAASSDDPITDDLESENARLRAELAEMRVRNKEVDKNLNREDLVLVPKAWKIRSHAMGRHPRGTILREDQFPPGVLDRMIRRKAVVGIYESRLLEGYEFPKTEPAPEPPETRKARETRELGESISAGITKGITPLFDRLGK